MRQLIGSIFDRGVELAGDRKYFVRIIFCVCCGDQGREACIAGRALQGGGAMKGGAARSLGENEERNNSRGSGRQFRV